MASVTVSWSGGIDGGVYVDVNGYGNGPYNANSYMNATLNEGQNSIGIQCGNDRDSESVTVTDGYPSPSSVSFSLS